MKNAKQKAETRKRVKPKEDSLTLAPGLKNEIDLTPKNFSFAQEIPLLRTLMQCLEERDPYSHGHSIRVAEYASILGVAIGLGKQALDTVQVAALLHDIGKIGIPDSVLLKPAPLTRPEFEIMKTHPVRSARILLESGLPQEIADGVLHHHERLDGLGYPNGLKGEEIPLLSRIILVADTFDAMTSTRPYRLSLPQDTSLHELRKYSGTQFDALLVEAFIRGISDAQIHETALDSLIKKIA